MQVHPSELVIAFEKTIEDFSDDFYRDGAFSFATEADVQSTLLGRLRANVLFNVRNQSIKTELVHAEFPAFGAWKNARHDLVIWNPKLAKQARDNWGTPVRQWPETVQNNLNLIAVEIKKIAGLPWELRQYQVFSKNAQNLIDTEMSKHSDIRKLRDSWCQFAYFLIFWDDDVNEKDDLRLCFNYLHKSCKKLTREIPKLRIFCISRDKAEFKVKNR